LARALHAVRALARLLTPLLLVLGLVWGGVAPASAVGLADLPADPPATHVLDTADLLSRAGNNEIEKLLEDLEEKHVEANLVTVNRLDYGLSLEDLGRQVLQRWSEARASGGATTEPQLLLLIDGASRSAAVVASPTLERQLPAELLRSTARTTMAIPLREGERYRQATVDGLERLTTVLAGAEDPGEPEVVEREAVVTNIPSKEETQSSNAFTWIVVLLVVGTLVPMLTWWVFSR
jgi:uncharacterized protein